MKVKQHKRGSGALYADDREELHTNRLGSEDRKTSKTREPRLVFEKRIGSTE